MGKPLSERAQRLVTFALQQEPAVADFERRLAPLSAEERTAVIEILKVVKGTRGGTARDASVGRPHPCVRDATLRHDSES